MFDDQKLNSHSGDWFLKKLEDRLKIYLVPKIPLWISSAFLTWLSILWSTLIILCFYLSKTEQSYLWFIPLFVVFHYLTDTLDGAVGRARNSGLNKWGFYVDHFLDFIFMTSVIIGYGIISGFNIWLFVLYIALSGFMIHTFLILSVNNVFSISFLKIGPTEGRLMIIIFSLIVIFMGVNIINTLLPYVTAVASILLLTAFFSTERNLWKTDIANKKARENTPQ